MRLWMEWWQWGEPNAERGMRNMRILECGSLLPLCTPSHAYRQIRETRGGTANGKRETRGPLAG